MVLERSEDHNRVARTVLDKAAELLLTARVRTLTNGQSMTLSSPEELQQHWGADQGCPAGKTAKTGEPAP
ncbi:MAG: hypothetical protein ACT4NY_20795 [Pseudonocardiales bacterium]